MVSLEALLRERSVTRAAARLGLTQPALSAALRRLRTHFGDELLIRVGNAYQLTPLAAFLLTRVTVAMENVERVFDANPEFDPAECTREFVILTSDYALALTGRLLLQSLAVRAPKARVRFRQPALAETRAATGGLRTADALLCPHGFPAGLRYLDLCTDRWVCIVSEDNTAVGERLTVEDLATMPWVAAVAEPTAYTPAEKHLELQGVKMHVEVVSDGFLAMPALIAGTPRIALMQERLTRTIPRELGIRVLECPFDAVRLVEALWWHPLSDADPEHRLLRSAFEDVALALAEPVPALA